MVVCDTAKVRFFKQITTTRCANYDTHRLFAILQKYDFSSKSQHNPPFSILAESCLRYCKSTIFQANHNHNAFSNLCCNVVCDTAKVRFFKQITTRFFFTFFCLWLFAILQKYDFSSKSQRSYSSIQRAKCCLRYCKSTIFQANHNRYTCHQVGIVVVCDTAKVRFFKQITTTDKVTQFFKCCLRYCKSTIFQANHNACKVTAYAEVVVCDTAKVRFFKQITTQFLRTCPEAQLFAILQKYDFSSKSQQELNGISHRCSCLRYCKSTIFQANHNCQRTKTAKRIVVCDTAKVRFFKQITTVRYTPMKIGRLFAILQKYDFSSKSQHEIHSPTCTNSCLRYCKSTIFQANHNTSIRAVLSEYVVCDTAKVRFFKQITTVRQKRKRLYRLFAILQKYDFSSKSQRG